MSQGSFINTQLQQLRTPLRTVDETNQYSQIADLVAKGLGLTAGVINAATNTQEQETALQNLENAKQAANARFVQSEQEAQDNLTMAGYKFESAQLQQQAALQEADLPKMLNQAGGLYTDVLEQNPGLLRPVREKVQNLLAQQQAETDVKQFQAMVLFKPQQTVQEVAAEFFKLKQGSYPNFDEVTRGQYLSYLQQAINRDVALKTVQNAELERNAAVNVLDDDMRNAISNSSVAGGLNRDTFKDIQDSYVNNALSTDNRRDSTTLIAQTYSALEQALVNADNVSSQQAATIFEKIFPKDENGLYTGLANHYEATLASALYSRIQQKAQAESSAKLSNISQAIKANPSNVNIVKQYISTQTSPTFTEAEKQASKGSIAQAAVLQLGTELDAVQTREGLRIVSDRARAYASDMLQGQDGQIVPGSAILSPDQYNEYKAKEIAKAESLEVKFKVEDVINRVKGWQSIELPPAADEYMIRHVEGLMQPSPSGGVSMTLEGGYQYMLETFNRIPDAWLSNLNTMLNSQPLENGVSPAADGAYILSTMQRSNPAYVSQLLTKEKISPKGLAIYAAIAYKGLAPDLAARLLSNVPATVMDGAYFKPTEKMTGATEAIGDAYSSWGETFSNYIGVNPGFSSKPDVEALPLSLYEAYQQLNYLNYALAWSQTNGGESVADYSAKAAKRASSDLATVGQGVYLGNYKHIFVNKRQPNGVTSSTFSLMQPAYNEVLREAEQQFEQVRYGVTAVDTDTGTLSADGKYYEWNVFRTDSIAGRNQPLAKFRWPVDENEQKRISDLLNAEKIEIDRATSATFGDKAGERIFNRSQYIKSKITQNRKSVFNDLFVPYKVGN